ncbi:aldo/keto reductase [Helicobacter sp. 16-1353]|nr:aldo/keto reductase [Helicobacter sp. 16-1353]
MKYIKLGQSDLSVSRICLGCMTFGKPQSSNQTWLLDQAKSDEMIKRSLELGINFFDTANTYNGGTSEEFLGKAIKKFAKREDVILATKVHFNEGKLSYKAIKREIDGSLKRLGTDYVDLYITHRFDYTTPVEETMRALDETIREGKVRYIGTSAMFAYQFYKMQEIARQNGYHTFISMQNHYNLIYREEEREMMQLLEEEKVMMTPYSPLAAGRLARSWRANTERSKNDNFAKQKYDRNEKIDEPICRRVEEISKKYGVSMSEVALAWLLSKPLVASPIVGVTKISHLEDAAKSVNLVLSQSDIAYLEELYEPHEVVGAIRP